MPNFRLPTFALWLDLETTGSDEEQDFILEIGAVLTHVTPDFPTVAHYASVIRPRWEAMRDFVDYDEVVGRMSEEVRAMHTKNGLLEALRAGEGHPVEEAEATILQMLSTHAYHQRVVLAGSGVAHFDRRFLKRWMPKLDLRLVHYSLDVGTTRRFARIAGHQVVPYYGPVDNPKLAHRALADTERAIEEARVYVSWLGKGAA